MYADDVKLIEQGKFNFNGVDTDDDDSQGIYARMYADYLKDYDSKHYEELSAKGRRRSICADKQRAVENYVKGAVEKYKSGNADYLAAEKRGDWWKTVTLAETQRVFAESFAIRFYIYGVYSD